MTNRRLCIIAMLILIVTAVISVGVAYGRYNSVITDGITFKALNAKYIQLHGVTDEYSSLNGDWADLPSSWNVNAEGEKFINFCVSNGSDSNDYCSDDIRYLIRVTVTSGFDPENADISITFTVDGVKSKYSGTASPIGDNSPMYELVGDGYMYCFYDDMHNEAAFTLSGGKLSVSEVSLTVSGTSDVSLIRYTVVPLFD